MVPGEAAIFCPCVSRRGTSLLFSQKKMAAWLLAHGADVNALNYEKKTPLRVTLDKGDDEMAALLRQQGGRE